MVLHLNFTCVIINLGDLMYYGDLRDYHNKKFLTYNIERKIRFLIYIIGLSDGNCFYKESKLNYFNDNYLKSEIKIIYNQIIDNVCKYILSLNIDDPNYIMVVLNKLIYSGFISYKKHFKWKNVASKEIDEMAYQVINGQGVCRNITQLSTDIFKKLGYEAYDLFCLPNKESTKISHMLTMVKYNNKTYYLDVTNNISFNHKNGCLYNNKHSFVIINFYEYNLNLLNKNDLYLMIEYYNKRRTNKDITKCMFEKLDDVCIDFSTNLELNDLSSVYKKNKKLYKKFKYMYL